MQAEHYQDAASAITQVVAFYARKCWWADPEDLEQDAWVAVITAEKKFDAARGEARGFFYRVAERALLPSIAKQRSILSASRAERDNLFTAMVFDSSLLEQDASPEPAPDIELDRKRWRASIRRQLAVIFGVLEGGSLAEACMVEDEKAKAVAAAFGVPVAAVYSATEKAKRAVASDRALFNLWRRDERNEH